MPTVRIAVQRGGGLQFGGLIRIFNIPEARIKSSGKESERVRAKSIAAYWAVKELGLAATVVGIDLNLTQSAVSRAARRGEEIVKELGISMVDEGNA
ncbi:MAG: hypothetical protein P4L55_09855 [Syntrophobacteraceae bacterium]|nr:hypothetical protein [Syntrophobacteraceae bacterium]